MTKNDQRKADCYSAGDRIMMNWWQGLRARLLTPVLAMLTGRRVTANGLTVLSLLAGLGFCPAYFFSRATALALLGVHVGLDALDGPLARHRGTASRRGSLLDTFCDQLVVAATTVTLMYDQVVAPLPGGIYLFLYTVIIAFAMVRNALSIPYTWLVRPRLLVYLWFVVEFYWLRNSIDYVLWGFSGILVIKAITGFIKISRRI